MVTIGQPGRHFVLQADTLGSLDIGAPVYFRQIQVGQVVSYALSKDGHSVDIKIFVEAPHHTQVTTNTRFWNASGVDLTLNAQGLKVDTQSVVSILAGGIAFELPKQSLPGEQAQENTQFPLYDDYSCHPGKEIYHSQLLCPTVRRVVSAASVLGRRWNCMG